MADKIEPKNEHLIQTHIGYNPRVRAFYFIIAGILLVLIFGFAKRQLIEVDTYNQREKVQSQRRILTPGTRGNIYDRNGVLLVTNRPRIAAVLYVDELRPEIRKAYLRIRKAYRENDDKDLPSAAQLESIARHEIISHYLQVINKITGRNDTLDNKKLNRHFDQSPLLPFILVNDLNMEEYACLIEQLPSNSPIELYTSSLRDYPQGSVAAQVIGYTLTNDDIPASRDFPGDDLTTFKMKGSIGKEGLEATFDNILQGESGGYIYRVDSKGYRLSPPLLSRQPTQGQDIRCTIDIDLQKAAENAILKSSFNGAAVAVDVNTGEILAMASKPDYNLQDFIPFLSRAASDEMHKKGAWVNRATSGLYPPGSPFKLIPAIAALRSGIITPETIIHCPGYYMVGRRRFKCNSYYGHGDINLITAIEKSCNVYFYESGLLAGANRIINEARNFHFGASTGIQINETRSTLVPDPEWKQRTQGDPWFPGDTANLAIGQGYLLVTPLQMALFTASFARGETFTPPKLVIPPEGNPSIHTPKIGIPHEQYAAIVQGMEAASLTGTARLLNARFLKIPGLRIASKTGTAQKGQTGKMINFAWIICFAPIENPRIAVAVVVEGDVPGEEVGGGRFAVPPAQAILKIWNQKYNTPNVTTTNPQE